jgi:hypothetical protein
VSRVTDVIAPATARGSCVSHARRTPLALHTAGKEYSKAGFRSQASTPLFSWVASRDVDMLTTQLNSTQLNSTQLN